jgi:transposase
MKRFVEGEDRRQGVLLPEYLDDFVAEENQVRVIDVFVDELDLRALGFAGVVPEATGRPAYHPATMLKIYVYGYINQIQSSRRLERETARNVEMMWLTGRLAPDFKTIADFRKDNGPAIRSACRQFVALCHGLNLFTQAIVAIDGSRFKAVNSRDRSFSRGSIERRMEQVEASIERYLSALETADRQEGELAEAKSARLKDWRAARADAQVQGSGSRRARRAGQADFVDRSGCAIDGDERQGHRHGRLQCPGRCRRKHHLIVAHEVTNIGNNRSQLSTMAKRAQAATGVRELGAIADRGYFKGEEILACEATGVTPLVPKPLTSGAKVDGRFGKQDFVYEAGEDVCRCPAGEKLTWRYWNVEAGRKLHNYSTTKCTGCALKSKCTPAKERRVKRWEHEAVLDAMQERLNRAPKTMRIRRQTAEHPFGTIKAWIGATHFRLRTLEKVSAETSLHVLAYNLKRMIAILGVQPLIQAMRAA